MITAPSAVGLDALAAELAGLAQRCGLEIERSEASLRLGPDGAGGEDGAGAEAVTLRTTAKGVELEFGGWRELVAVDDDPADCLSSARDFVAAALFGELRVIEIGRGGRVLQTSLECRVDGRWRRHARRGRLGLAGLRARIARALDRRVRCNGERLPRPPGLRESSPRGLPSAPWIGAGAGASQEAAAELPVDGELDLHNFSPKEVGPLVREYIEVCRARGILDLRIVHGKGKGVLRRTVHSLLDKHEAVADYRLGGAGEGSWGATIVRLRPRD